MSAPRSQTLPPENASGAVARHTDKRYRLPALRARSPLGAPPRCLPRKLMPRLSPGRASCEREDAGVTHTIGRTHSDAPRAPVIVPAGVDAQAAREQFARLPAGTALAPL